MIQIASINIQSKINIYGVLSESFTLIQGFHQGCPLSMLLSIIVAELLAVSIDGDMSIKGIQIVDNEIKRVNFADGITIFLRNFSCLTKIELILELSKNASSSNLNFSKKQALCGVACKNRIVKPIQMVWSQFSIKMVAVHFHNSARDNRNWDKIYDNLTKKIHIWNRIQLFLRGKK